MDANGHRLEGVPIFPPGYLDASALATPVTNDPLKLSETVRLLRDLLAAQNAISQRIEPRERARGWFLSWCRWPWQRDEEIAELRAKLAVAEIERDMLAQSNESLMNLVRTNLGFTVNMARMAGWTGNEGTPSQLPAQPSHP